MAIYENEKERLKAILDQVESSIVWLSSLEGPNAETLEVEIQEAINIRKEILEELTRVN